MFQRKDLFINRLSDNVELAMSEIFPNDDPIDKPDFNVIDFFNKNFPNEQSLSEMDPFLNKIKDKIDDLDNELSNSIQEQSKASIQATKDLQDAKNAVYLLVNKIKDIKKKANQSEVMVQEICRDIKQLDYAKRHLQNTISALKRLHMLITAIDQLEYMVSQRQYQETSNLIEAVDQLLSHFENYIKIAKIRELNNRLFIIKNDLFTQILEDFKAVGPFETILDINYNQNNQNNQNNQENDVEENILRNLSYACNVADALGEEKKNILIQNFCTEQLKTYNQLFGPENENGKLIFVERRFPWFYRMVKSIEKKLERVFPAKWQICRRLSIFFCEKTRGHILHQLGSLAIDEIDVTILLKALQKTLLFERDLVDKYELKRSNSRNDGNGPSENIDIDETGNLIDPNSAEGIRKKYQRRKNINKNLASTCTVSSTTNQNINDIKNDEKIFPTFVGIISASFDPYMTSYVALESKNMENMINEVMGKEHVDRDGPLPVFSSSINVFIYIRNSVKRCTALTNGQTFFNLQNQFKHCLDIYAQRLLAKIPNNNNNNSNNDTTSSNVNNGTPTSINEVEEILCFVINTSEYCAETLPSLEEAIRNKIDIAYHDAIDFTKNADTFYDTAASAIKYLLNHLELKIEPFFLNFIKLPWHQWDHVGDENLYVRQIIETIASYIPTLREMLSTLYYNNFCDKFSSFFVQKYLQLIFKCKKINEMGTQQLLLDTHSFKNFLLQMPLVNKDLTFINPETSNSDVISDASSNSKDKISSILQIPLRYIKFVMKEMANIETVLKLMGTPSEVLVQSFKIMWPEGTVEDLQQIMTIKGFRKAEIQSNLEIFNKTDKSATASDTNSSTITGNTISAGTNSSFSTSTSQTYRSYQPISNKIGEGLNAIASAGSTAGSLLSAPAAMLKEGASSLPSMGMSMPNIAIPTMSMTSNPLTSMSTKRGKKVNIGTDNTETKKNDMAETIKSKFNFTGRSRFGFSNPNINTNS